MEQTEFKFEITFKSSYTKEELGDMVEVWLKRSLDNMLDQHCELESFALKAVHSGLCHLFDDDGYNREA